MKKEYAEFMENLKHELQTQPTDGNRDPRFWGIKEEKRELGFNSEYADGWEAYDGEMVCSIGEPDDVQSVIDEFISDYGFSAEQFDKKYEDFYEIDKTDIEDVIERANNIRAKEKTVSFMHHIM
ncbi:MAG: hypothetical protein PHS82_06280 [Lachnospiraceae bacterium]|nr:hypothetical protein [Lachnospiraceae bacterium]